MAPGLTRRDCSRKEKFGCMVCGGGVKKGGKNNDATESLYVYSFSIYTTHFIQSTFAEVSF